MKKWITGLKAMLIPLCLTGCSVKTELAASEMGELLMGLGAIAAGIYCVVCPYNVWYYSKGWQYKDAEPTDGALGVTIFGGIVMIIGGVILIATTILE